MAFYYGAEIPNQRGLVVGSTYYGKEKGSMTRKLVAAVIFALAVPATAFACSEKAQAQKSDDSQVLLAQNDPNAPKTPTKGKSGKKGKKAKKPMMQ